MKTMLDKCAVAGDITQATDRRGAWSCAITVIGGTESTAVKLQSCETADGTFEDFKTLIPSAEASASQYKGFVVDISGAGNFIKVTGATMATCVLGDCNADVKKIAIKAGEIPSGADLEDNKEVSITENGTIVITPTEGKDGMKKVTATVNVPSSGEQTLYIWSLETGSESVILPAGTFAEVTIGMKGVACTASSEFMFRGTVISKDTESITFKDLGGNYIIYISNTVIATEFPDLS